VYYGRLASPTEGVQFVVALLSRMDGEKGYLAVSYFIVRSMEGWGSLERRSKDQGLRFPKVR